MAITAEATPEWKLALPPIPKWDIDGVRHKAQWFSRHVFAPFHNLTIDANVVDEVLDALAECDTPLTERGVHAVRLTLQQHVGHVMDKKAIRIFSYQCAANFHDINDGIPIPAFTGIPQGQWVPLRIVGFMQPGPKTIPMCCLIVDGRYAGFTVVKHVPFGMLPIFARDVGYSQRRKYEEPADLVQLLFAAWIEPSPATRIQFTKYWLTTYMHRHNYALIKERKPTARELEAADDDA